MLSTLAPALPARFDALLATDGLPFSTHRRRELAQRYVELRSGREKPGRYWRIDLDALDLEALPHADPESARPQIEAPPNIIALPVRLACERFPQLIERALAHVDCEREKFAALAAALQNGGAFVYAPKETRAAAPVVLTYAVAGAAFPLTLVLAERGAEVTIHERLEGGGFFCGVSHAHVEENARVEIAFLQILQDEGRAILTRTAHVEKDGVYSCASAELGASLAVSTIVASLAQSGGQAQLAGVFFPTQRQHVDVATTVEHIAGNTSSETLVKSGAAGRGQARFLGNIRIVAEAQGSQASLRDDALVLSPNAHVDSVPALEIAANEVKAFHGATVGAIDEEQIFYMTTRGIDRAEAETMVALGFFEPAIERFPSAGLRDELREALQRKVRA